MTKRLAEISDEDMEAAREALQARTIRETVTAALRMAAAQAARHREIERPTSGSLADLAHPVARGRDPFSAERAGAAGSSSHASRSARRQWSAGWSRGRRGLLTHTSRGIRPLCGGVATIRRMTEDGYIVRRTVEFGRRSG
ncbi:MAG: hypothetical protein ACJ73E_02605 [Mycobacteriales bacterium]